MKIAWKITRFFPGTNFNKSNLLESTFRGAVIENVSFFDANLAYTDWYKAKFMKIEAGNEWVSELEITRSGSDANYHSRIFERLNLNKVDLQGENLKGCSFKESRLISSNLMHSNLSGVNFLGANLSNSDLTGAIIENWIIDRSTNFSNVRCDYIYLSEDKDPQQRKPLSGYFSPGDFEKVVTSLTDTLDFLLHAHDDPQAFFKAIQEMMGAYGPQTIHFMSFEKVGDEDHLLKLDTSSDIDKVKAHAKTSSRMAELQLEAAQQRERANQLEIEHNFAVYRGDLLDQLIDKHLPKLLDQSRGDQIHINFAKVVEVIKQKIDTGGGDASGIAGGNISGVAGKDIQGAAGRDLSGQVMLSIESLRQSDIPEAPTLADLLSQLKEHIDSSDLPPETKTTAQSHIEQLAKAPTLPTPEGIKEAADKSIGFFQAISQILPSLSSAINGLLGQIAALLG